MPFESEYLPGGEIDRRIDSRNRETEDRIKGHVDESEARLMAKFDTLERTLINGAQASLYTAGMLAGNEQFGQKGIVHEFRDRFTAMDERLNDRDKTDGARWLWIKKQFRTVKRNQGSIKRCVEQVGKVAKWVPWQGWVSGGLLAVAEVTPWHPIRNALMWLAAHWPHKG